MFIASAPEQWILTRWSLELKFGKPNTILCIGESN